MSDDKNPKGIKPNFYFDEELTAFVIELESDQTMEIIEIAELLEQFAGGLRSGDVPLYDADDETVMH
jgi:hypothetical protein